MCNAVAMAEAECGDELLEVAACSRLKEATVTRDLKGELVTANEVNDEVDLSPCAHDLMDEENIRVVVEVVHGIVRSTPLWCRLSSTCRQQEFGRVMEKGWSMLDPIFFSMGDCHLTK